MRKIMIVEDEILVRVGLKSFLNWEEYGYIICDEAADGREALKKIEKEQPDIVLTDLKMDGMDGFELIRICREQWPDIHFIVLSSYNDFDNVREAMKLGADDYIFKLASSPEKLLKTLNEVSEKMEAIKKRSKKEANERMNTFVSKNVSNLKRSFISDAIKGNVVNTREYIEEFSKILKLNVTFDKPYTLLYVSIDDYENIKAGQGSEGILKSSVEDIIYKAVDESMAADVFNYTNGDFIVVLQTVENNYSTADLKRLFEHIALYIKRYAGAGISGYVGENCCGIEDLQEIAGNMRRRMYGRLPCDYGKLNFYTDNMREEIAYIEKYIYDHLDRELTVSNIASVVNMSESYFSHVFKKEAGQSFTNYVNFARINKAKDLLKNSDLKINEIAAMVGLENANYFSTLFKKLTGKSPNQYRGISDR